MTDTLTRPWLLAWLDDCGRIERMQITEPPTGKARPRYADISRPVAGLCWATLCDGWGWASPESKAEAALTWRSHGWEVV